MQGEPGAGPARRAWLRLPIALPPFSVAIRLKFICASFQLRIAVQSNRYLRGFVGVRPRWTAICGGLRGPDRRRGWELTSTDLSSSFNVDFVAPAAPKTSLVNHI